MGPPLGDIIFLVLLLVILVIPFLVFGPVAKKAGFSRWWALLVYLPLVNVVMLWVFAFMEWPAQKTHNLPASID